MINRRKSIALRRKSRPRQHGAVLIISLILLLVMTMLGIAGIRLITTEERMVTQSYDRTVAFQAAEAALREVEVLVEEAGQPSPAAAAACASMGAPKTMMTCGAPTPASTPRWVDIGFADWTNSTVVGTGTLQVTPQYFVEYLGNTFPCGFDPGAVTATCKRYRITTRAQPGAGRAAVTLQSIYATS